MQCTTLGEQQFTGACAKTVWPKLSNCVWWVNVRCRAAEHLRTANEKTGVEQENRTRWSKWLTEPDHTYKEKKPIEHPTLRAIGQAHATYDQNVRIQGARKETKNKQPTYNRLKCITIQLGRRACLVNIPRGMSTNYFMQSSHWCNGPSQPQEQWPEQNSHVPRESQSRGTRNTNQIRQK